MEANGNQSHGAAKDTKSDNTANGNHAATKSKDSTPISSTTPTHGSEGANKSPRKRRKVNHGMLLGWVPEVVSQRDYGLILARVPTACVYCRRSHMTCDLERPCTRCIKRNIGHLCHDEPRDPDSKKSKVTHSQGASGQDESEAQPDLARNPIDQSVSTTMGPPSYESPGASQGTKAGFGTGALGQTNPLQLVSPNPVSRMQANASSSSMNQFAGFSDAWLTAQNQFHDMHSYNPQYMLAPEVTHEFNLLNERPQRHAAPKRNAQWLDASAQRRTRKSHPRPTSVIPADKTREFYLQAADPSGNDTPEERMQRVLKAKYDAGLLKPFNYIMGYARLGTYMDSHIAPASKQKILRQLNQFRPKFREKMHNLTDMELIYVEMWFEKTLLEYDRVFAAMAVPACCWRRTGEIFRGNKEMAELIHVPVEQLRDGKISLHQILTEESLVRYWEEFGTIAFDPAHDTLLTACALKSPDDRSKDPIVNCCFSFMIRRDDYKIPSLIVGNFLPHDPSQ
ncbi:hypothetical protein PG994_001640 [Apiospora phragmitis]|uniref:Zn(2)-C6 fungal-type domain-containing protein n=1 Tax=Apiospora phragmitis TaxID=2905665 RepID=A0ABR1WU37_9PEZI